MDETCHKAQEIDLALFLLEPQGPEWQEFRAHYPYCVTCCAELQKWTALEQHLHSMDNSGATAHPSAETLVRFQRRSHLLPAEERATIAGHLCSCTACREEVKLLGSFDFSLMQEWVRGTQPIAITSKQPPWSTRFWDALRTVFFHPAFAYGLVLLIAIPFIRSYYSSSFNRVPLSSEVASAPAPASVEQQPMAKQEKKGRAEGGQASQNLPQGNASAPIRMQSLSEKAKEDTAPAKLAKQSSRREDWALKDEQAPKPPPLPAAPAPSISVGAARDLEAPVQQKSRIEEKERRMRAEPPAPAVAAEGRTGSPEMLAARKRQVETRDARSTEGATPQQERMEKDPSFASSARSVSPQVRVHAWGNSAPQESRPRAALTSLTETYKNAYEARDINALDHVWNMDLAWREALTKLFAQSQQITVSLTLNEGSLTESADQRQVSVPFSQTITTVHQDGQVSTHGPFFCIADLRKQSTDPWRIHDLQEDPQHPGQCRVQ